MDLSPYNFVFHDLPALADMAGFAEVRPATEALARFIPQIDKKNSRERRARMAWKFFQERINDSSVDRNRYDKIDHIVEPAHVALRAGFGVLSMPWNAELHYGWIRSAIYQMKRIEECDEAFRKMSFAEIARQVSPDLGNKADDAEPYWRASRLLEHRRRKEALALTADTAVRELAPWLLVVCFGRDIEAKLLRAIDSDTTLDDNARSQARKIAVERLYAERFKHPMNENQGWETWSPSTLSKFSVSHIGVQVLQILDGPQDDESIRRESLSMLRAALFYSAYQDALDLDDQIFDHFFGIRSDLSQVIEINTLGPDDYDEASLEIHLRSQNWGSTFA